MSAINMYYREEQTPAIQNPPDSLEIVGETENLNNELPSLIKPAIILLSAFFTWDYLT